VSEVLCCVISWVKQCLVSPDGCAGVPFGQSIFLVPEQWPCPFHWGGPFWLFSVCF